MQGGFFMMIRYLLIVLTFVSAAVLTAQTQQEIDVRVGWDKRVNDTLLFRGITGDHELNKAIAKDLQNCGWFDLVNSGVSNYILSGSASGGTVRLQLANGAGEKIADISASGSDTTRISHKAVDALLKYLYKIPGICSSKIVFTAQTRPMQKEIYLCDYDGNNIRQLTRNGGLSLDPVWTPGGKTVIYSFVGRTYTSLVELNWNTGANRRLVRFSGLNAGGRVSPDGRKVALVLSKDNQVDLYVRNLDGGPLKRLTNDQAVEASPCWSPDGSRICYVSDAGYSRRPRLRIISANGGSSAPVRGLLGSESVSPSWGKDGKITYSAKLGNYSVAVIDPDNRPVPRGSKQKFGRIVEYSGDWESPSWAPDGRHVVCSCNYGIYIVDTWGANRPRKILSGKSHLSLPNWSGILY